MKRSVKKSLGNVAGYAVASVMSAFPKIRKAVHHKMTRHTSHGSSVVLYSGIALAAAGAAYYVFRNREAFMAGISDFMESYGLKTATRLA